MSKRCTHGTIRSNTDTDDRWICSVCKRRFEWGEESGYFGLAECAKCGLTAVDAVVCSENCKKLVKVKRGQIVILPRA